MSIRKPNRQKDHQYNKGGNMHTSQYKSKTDQEEPQYNIGGNIHISNTDHEKHNYNICGNIHIQVNIICAGTNKCLNTKVFCQK